MLQLNQLLGKPARIAWADPNHNPAWHDIEHTPKPLLAVSYGTITAINLSDDPQYIVICFTTSDSASRFSDFAIPLGCVQTIRAVEDGEECELP